MNQNTRTYILIGILVVMIIYYVSSTFLFNDSGSSSREPVPRGKLSTMYRNNTGLASELEYPNILAARGGWGEDPFYYENPGEGRAGLFGNFLEDLPLPGEALQLKGIVWSDNVPTVLINNEVLKIGDEINGYRIVNVGQDFVTLRSGNERLQLTLGE